MNQPMRDPPLEKRYALVERVLRANILSKRLPPGLLLREAAIADLLQTSRAPVIRALQALEAEKLISRPEGRRFVVGNGAADLVRQDIRELGLAVPEEVDEALQSRGSWERIAQEVEASLAACLVFGEYRIIENELAQHFNVSRTVVRDVLSRLQERGLVRKNQSSHWLVGPLTAHTLREHYELRAVLEPAALRAVAGHLDRETLALLRERATLAEAGLGGNLESWDEIESVFIDHSILRAPNRLLVEAIKQNHIPVRAANRLLSQLGLPSDRAAISECRIVVELLLDDAVTAAALYWRDHLEKASSRSIARLKIVAVVPQPQQLATYLTPLL